MGASFLIGLREGLEISLIVAIVLAYLKRTHRTHLFRPVLSGTAAAIAVCIAAGVAFYFGVEKELRGTTEAGAMAVFLYQLRQPDLNLRITRQNLGLRDDLCEDPPAWWLLKKKKTMYQTGSNDARSVRSIMQFMLSPLNPPSAIKKEETTFRDIQAFILSLEPPKYPFPIDQKLAAAGHKNNR